jgi:hypothetical protein
MPPIGLVLGKVDFANLFISLNGVRYDTLAAAQAAGAPTINYGTFINMVISFLIVAFVIFLLVKKVNAMRSKPMPPAPTQRTALTANCSGGCAMLALHIGSKGSKKHRFSFLLSELRRTKYINSGTICFLPKTISSSNLILYTRYRYAGN